MEVHEPRRAAARVRGEPRPGAFRRWVLRVTLAETIGYLAPSLTGILSTRAGWTELGVALAVTVGGFGEGLALGLGQASAFPFPVRRLRYAALTAGAAMFVWASVMVMMHVAPSLPLAAALAIGVPGPLLAIGTAQWLELRHHVSRSQLWIAWTALAWLLALPLSFAPGLLVDANTPLAAHLALWTAGGFLMALVMALVTWQGVRRLLRPNRSPRFLQTWRAAGWWRAHGTRRPS